jgi:tetratricopeptide (TPR) repeat protein
LLGEGRRSLDKAGARTILSNIYRQEDFLFIGVNSVVSSPKAKKGKLTVKEMKRDPMWDLYENVNSKIAPYKQQLIRGAIGLVALVAIGSLGYVLINYFNSRGQEAFGQALEIYNAQVIAPGSDAEKNKNSAKKSYPDEQQKYKEAAAAFDNVAASYSSHRDIAKYYAALSRTHFDPAKAQSDLEAMSKENTEIGFWSKVGLAESYAAAGQFDKAVATYQQLKDNPGPLPKSLVLYNLGHLYERQGKSKEAIEAYYQSASADRSSAEGKKAHDRLNVLDPATAKKVPPEKKEDSDI